MESLVLDSDSNFLERLTDKLHITKSRSNYIPLKLIVTNLHQFPFNFFFIFTHCRLSTEYEILVARVF